MNPGSARAVQGDDLIYRDNGSPAPLVDPREGRDDSWQIKVERAKEARAAAQSSRKGKTPVFPMNWSLPQAKH